ncbi:spore cortex biosynthesis protein YabQ [Lysinibacillus sp. 54212]|uniref:spore cortex biosynthesis protein YabQ n=1 Tax=Lysinibacillus sp. 54212 TaxID=3119829 RepID=UPI002FC79C4E
MISAQLLSTIVMFVSGIAVGAIIDCVRITLGRLPPKSVSYKLSNYIEVVVWALLGAGTFYLLFLVKGGEWRIIDPLAQIAGILSYNLFFQRMLRFFGRIFVILFIKPVLFIVRMIMVIIRNILLFILRILTVLFIPFSKIYKKLHRITFKKRA